MILKKSVLYEPFHKYDIKIRTLVKNHNFIYLKVNVNLEIEPFADYMNLKLKYKKNIIVQTTCEVFFIFYSYNANNLGIQNILMLRSDEADPSKHQAPSV